MEHDTLAAVCSPDYRRDCGACSHYNIEIDFSFELTAVDTTSDWSETAPQIKLFESNTGQTQGALFDPNELIYVHLRSEAEKLRVKD